MNRNLNVVAVFNTSPDTVDMLRLVLEHAGFVVVSAYTYELRDAKVDLEAFMRQHQPGVVVYDIAPPYEENWRLFVHFRSLDVLKDAHFVVTTTNCVQVRKLAGPEQPLHEIVGKPYDLDEIVRAVQERAAEGMPAARPSPG
jgi:DNA-binding response OmpR family regulator